MSFKRFFQCSQSGGLQLIGVGGYSLGGYSLRGYSLGAYSLGAYSLGAYSLGAYSLGAYLQSGGLQSAESCLGSGRLHVHHHVQCPQHIEQHMDNTCQQHFQG